MLSRWLGLRAVHVGLVLHSVLAIALSFVPLFDVLGFERAFLSGVFAAPITATITISAIRAARDAGTEHDVARIAGEATFVGLLLLVPTVLAGLIVEWVTAPCNPGEGITFILLLPGISSLFGAGLGAVAGVLTRARIVPGLVVAISLGAALVAALLRLYSEPQIFVFSAPFGYWPGSLYDEEVGLSIALMGHRSYALALGLTWIAVARAIAEPDTLVVSRAALRIRPTLLAIALGALTLLVRSHGRELGFDVDRSAIQAQLSRQVRGDGYELFVDPSIGKDQLEQFVGDIEFRMDQLDEFFGSRPERVLIYVYRDVHQKKALMGAANTQIAKPWSGEIHIHGFDVPHRVLKHELAHVYAAQWSDAFFAVPAASGLFPNIAIIEGVAVAADWRVYRSLTVHEWARAMRELGLAPDIASSLYPTGFWAVSSSRAYTLAGSFIAYLRETHGRAKLAELYRTNDFGRAYGRSVEALAAEWASFIDARPISARHLLIAEHRFKQPGIFQKACAHTVAQLSQEGYAMLHSGDISRATDRFERVLEYSPQRTDVLIALAEFHIREDELAKAKSIVEKAIERANTAESRGRALELRADIAWLEGDQDAARRGFSEVLTLHTSAANDRLQTVKLAALDRPDDVQSMIRDYLLGRTPPHKAMVELLRSVEVHPDDAILHYLLARRLEAVTAFEQAETQVERAIALGLPSNAIVREAHMTLGRVLFASKTSTRAASVFEAVADKSNTEGDRREALDWVERARRALPAAGTPEE